MTAAVWCDPPLYYVILYYNSLVIKFQHKPCWWNITRWIFVLCTGPKTCVWGWRLVRFPTHPSQSGTWQGVLSSFLLSLSIWRPPLPEKGKIAGDSDLTLRWPDRFCAQARREQARRVSCAVCTSVPRFFHPNPSSVRRPTVHAGHTKGNERTILNKHLNLELEFSSF